MTPSAGNRTLTNVRRRFARLGTAFRRFAAAVTPARRDGDKTTRRGRYELDAESATATETRWRGDAETVSCFRFDDGYVVTVRYGDRDVTWQLTPGQLSLGSALATAELYLQYGVTVQIDAEGRPFVGVADHGPRQVFEEIADEPVRYVYFDIIRTLDEFPSFLECDDEQAEVFERMSPSERHRLHGE